MKLTVTPKICVQDGHGGKVDSLRLVADATLQELDTSMRSKLSSPGLILADEVKFSRKYFRATLKPDYSRY